MLGSSNSLRLTLISFVGGPMRKLTAVAAAMLLSCSLMNAQIATTTTLTSVTPAKPIFGQTVTLTA